MKKNVVLLFLSVLCLCACRQKREDIIADTKKKVADINGSLKEYTNKHVDDLTSADPGAITGYFREEEVKKVYAENFGQKDRTFTEYYFDDGMLIYVLIQDYIYNKPTTYTEEVARRDGDSVWYDDKKTKLELETYYFSENKMISATIAGKAMPPADPDFGEKGAVILAHADILIKELNEQ